MYHDGGGLYLQVSAGGAKSWIFRFMLDGRAREMGLGPVHAIPLAEARKRAAECRRMRLDGIDPIEARKAQRDAEEARSGQVDDLRRMCRRLYRCAQGRLAEREASRPMAQHAEHLRGPGLRLLAGAGGRCRARDEGPGADLATKPETASRLRGRIEAVLDWATVRGYRKGENPARWRGHLDKLLPARSKVRKVEHHPALPYVELADFITALRSQDGIAARALEFLILTATRTGEVIGARWDEIDLEEKIWIVPAARMKAGREHRVPLSTAALAILSEMKESRESDFVFPGGKKGKPLSNMAMLAVLKRMDRGDLTAHGFRSSFRDWAAERTNFPREVAEMALAHVVDDKVEAAYRRGDLFEKRRQLMEAWARFCETTRPQAEVVPISKRA